MKRGGLVMKKSDFKLQIGNWQLQGILGIILAVLIMIPVLALVGLILSVVFSIVGVVLTLALGIALIAIIIGLVIWLIPPKWRSKLGINIKFGKKSSDKAKTTPDGKEIIDVEFEEEK